jgi:hypothetical protein
MQWSVRRFLRIIFSQGDRHNGNSSKPLRGRVVPAFLARPLSLLLPTPHQPPYSQFVGGVRSVDLRPLGDEDGLRQLGEARPSH